MRERDAFTMSLTAISNSILDESSSSRQLRDALDRFALLCGDVSNIRPDPSFDAWADDALLEDGVAINPQAAAHCVVDYQRSVVFIRGVYAAIKTVKTRFPDTVIDILYAGCGPFATLLLPALGKFTPGTLNITLLDIHQRSLDSAEQLLAYFDLSDQRVQTVRGDAASYQHPGNLHLVIAETMQKALEQEPQYAVTANLAPQLCHAGIFIPENIEVTLYLTDLEHEATLIRQSQQIDQKAIESCGKRHPLAIVCTLSPELAAGQLQEAQYNQDTAKLELASTTVTIPALHNLAEFDVALFTRIRIFEQYCLMDYESEITLPLKCHDLTPLVGGERYRVSYELGNYPRFNFAQLGEK
jgi:hypothetical protein